MNYNKYFTIEVEISFKYNNLIRDVSFISTLTKKRGYLNWKETNILVPLQVVTGIHGRVIGCDRVSHRGDRGDRVKLWYTEAVS